MDVTDEVLESFAKTNCLTSVKLIKSNLTFTSKSVVKLLKNNPNLLTFCYSASDDDHSSVMNDETVEILVQNCQKLVKVGLDARQITVKSLKHLAFSKNLTELKLAYMGFKGKVTDEDIRTVFGERVVSYNNKKFKSLYQFLPKK